MAANLFQPSLSRALDSNGNPVNGAKMYFYLTGTTTPATWFTDQAGTVAGTNPLTADSTGIFAPAYMDPATTYRIVLKTGDDATTIWDVDPVRGFDETQLVDDAAAASQAATDAEAAQTAAAAAQAAAEAAQTAAELAETGAAATVVAAQQYFPAARTHVPQGAVTGAGTISTAGTGGTNGTFALAFSGGNFAVNPTGTFTVAGGIVTAITITGAGLYVGGSISAPTLSFAASTGLTGAAGTYSTAYLKTAGQTWLTDTDPASAYLALYQNDANAAVEIDAQFDPMSAGAAAQSALDATTNGAVQVALAADEAANALASATEAATSAGLITAGHMATSKPVNGTTLGAVASFGSSTGSVTRAYWDGIMWRKFSDGTYLAFYQVATTNVDGDSIGRGVSASPTTNGWAYSQCTTMGSTISNRSVDGTVVSNQDALANNLRDTFQTDLLGTNLKASAIICRGYNDARRPASLLSEFASDYREIVTRCLMSDAYSYQSLILGQPYYITDTGLVTGTTGFTGQTRAGFETYVDTVTTIASEWGLPLIPFYDYLESNSSDRTAWIADVNGNDAIHPTNTGHTLLATIARTQTYVANTLPRVANLAFVSSASGSFTVQWDRQQSADSYEVEYGLFSNLNFSTGSTTAAQAGTSTISKTVTSLAEGVYIARVRGVYGAQKGPWALTRSAYAVTGSLVETVNGLTGSLAGANGTTLASVTPTTGTWTNHPTSTTTMAVNGSSRIRGGAGTSIFTLYTLASQAIPTGGRVYSEADTFNGGGFTAGTILQGVIARLDATNRVGICALYNGSTIRLFFLNGGTSYTQLGIYTPSASLTTYTLRLECGDGTQTVYLDGVPIIVSTTADASMPGLGTTQGIMMQTAGFGYTSVSNTGLLFTRVETGYLS